MRIRLGKVAREVRITLGLTQRRAAKELGISPVHLCRVEKNQASPSQALIDKYRDLWNIDIYVLAWCKHGCIHKLPRHVRTAAESLRAEWQRELRVIADRIEAARTD